MGEHVGAMEAKIETLGKKAGSVEEKVSSGMPNWLGTLIYIGVVILVGYILLRIVHELLKKAHYGKGTKEINGGRLKTFNQVLYSAIRAVVVFVGIALVLDRFGVNTASILAAAGIGGIAVAFGAQRVIADVFTGMFILLDNTLNVGDFVSLAGGVTGTVTSMNIRQTIVKDYTGICHYIPNSEIKIIANYGHEPDLQCDVKVDVPNSLSFDRCLELLQQMSEDVTTAHPEYFSKAPYLVGTEQLGPFTYTIQIGARTDVEYFWAAQRAMRAAFLQKLQAEDCYPLAGQMLSEANKAISQGKKED